jgi:GNAT superfamily N-acetyltransferase
MVRARGEGVPEGEFRLDFRDMTGADLEEGLRLSQASGWNQAIEDWRLLLSLGPGLFRVAVEGDRVVASGGAVHYGDALAWICMILVDPARRGYGIGTRVFDDVLALTRGFAIVGLDATPGGRPIYERTGFAEAYGLARMEREPGSSDPVGSGAPTEEGERVRPLAHADLEAVLAWDREAFGADRGRALEWALRCAPEYGWGAFGPAGLAGYVLGRHGRRFEHLGPLVARGVDTAEALAAACLLAFPARRFGIDAPTDRPDWQAVLHRRGFREARPFTRMYRSGEGDPGRRDVVFAVLGPEFG